MAYRMKLHLDPVLFRQSVQFTADQMKIPAIYIEKDYWVTFTLHTIFNNEIGKEFIFKGGTSLSKCYQMIDRFSEDIDLVALKREGESNNQLTNKIKKISTIVSAVLPEVEILELTQKKGMNRKTAHTFPQIFEGHYGQVRDVIVIEATWLGYFEPFTTKSICSFIGSMMLNNDQQEIAEANGLLPFELLVLEPTRTICEKIMSLVRFSYGENPIDNLKKKVRHTFDLHQILQQEEFSKFLDSPEFDQMLLNVANDDVKSFKNSNEWLIYHPINSLFFFELNHAWEELKATYNGDFKKLYYGVNFPNDTAVLITLKRIKERLSKITWNIEMDN